MYRVVGVSVCNKKGTVVLTGVNRGYALFLCEMLNSGYTVDDIKHRPRPDREYLQYKAVKVKEGIRW